MDDDATLVEQARRGSREAASALFAAHWEPSRRVALAVCGRPAMADDVAQDSMVQAFSALHTFRGEAPFAGWLRRIVVNRALNALRAERPTVSIEDADLSVEDSPRLPDPALREAVERLPVDQRVAVALRYGADLTPAEIADTTGVAVGTVHSRLARALAHLRETLEVADV